MKTRKQQKLRLPRPCLLSAEGTYATAAQRAEAIRRSGLVAASYSCVLDHYTGEITVYAASDPAATRHVRFTQTAFFC